MVTKSKCSDGIAERKVNCVYISRITVKMNQVYLSLGSNVGSRSVQLQNAVDLLNETGLVKKISSVYETAAWGNTDQPSFLNLVLMMLTNNDSRNFMKQLLLIEEKMGRVRHQKWEARIIDIDILYFNAEIFQEESLIIPHPHLQERKFVLEPLAEIAPEFIHPILNLNSIQLLNQCPDKLQVKKLQHA